MSSFNLILFESPTFKRKIKIFLNLGWKPIGTISKTIEGKKYQILRKEFKYGY